MSSAEDWRPPRLAILYRGPLASCNYGCGYCPFEKQAASPAELEQDRLALERLVGWIAAQKGEGGTDVFFTPWGEALIHPHYQRAIAALSRLQRLGKVAIQTNLSAPLSWLDSCRSERIGIWATYHPGHVYLERFLARCLELHRRGVSFSVGVVGLREHLEPITALRRELPRDVYLWINAFKRGGPDYYSPAELARLQAIDPLIDLNLRPQPSRGRPCRTGTTVVAVAGDGTVRRCPFTDEVLGSLQEFTLHRSPQPCSEAECRCHLGYVHLVDLELHERFGAGLLERALPR